MAAYKGLAADLRWHNCFSFRGRFKTQVSWSLPGVFCYSALLDILSCAPLSCYLVRRKTWLETESLLCHLQIDPTWINMGTLTVVGKAGNSNPQLLLAHKTQRNSSLGKRKEWCAGRLCWPAGRHCPWACKLPVLHRCGGLGEIRFPLFLPVVCLASILRSRTNVCILGILPDAEPLWLTVTATAGSKLFVLGKASKTLMLGNFHLLKKSDDATFDTAH